MLTYGIPPDVQLTRFFYYKIGGLSFSDESFPNEGARGAFAKPRGACLREGFAEPPGRHHEPFAEVYEPFAEVAHTEGSTKTPWRVHEASSKSTWMNCMFLLDHDCNRVWSILYCFKNSIDSSALFVVIQ